MKKIIFTAYATFLCFAAFSQDTSKVQMFGKVFDADSKPIEQVTIILKGTDYKTTTNGEGAYFFMLPAQKGTIVYSHAGYSDKEIPFTGTPQANDISLNKKD